MCEKRTYPIRCPPCGREQEVELYESIDALARPELRDAVIGNRLNVVTCKACGHTFRVDMPLLYVDPGHEFIVHLLPAGDGDVERAVGYFDRVASAMARLSEGEVELPAMHLVLSRVEMVERIFLLEAGLDERVIEYVKYLVYSRNEGRLDPRTKNLLFDAQDSTEEELCFVVQDLAGGALEGMLRYRRDAYRALCEMFDEDAETPALLELFPGPCVSARRLLAG